MFTGKTAILYRQSGNVTVDELAEYMDMDDILSLEESEIAPSHDTVTQYYRAVNTIKQLKSKNLSAVAKKPRKPRKKKEPAETATVKEGDENGSEPAE